MWRSSCQLERTCGAVLRDTYTVQHAGSCLQAALRYTFHTCKYTVHATNSANYKIQTVRRSFRHGGGERERGGRCWWGWWWLRLDPDVGLLTSVAPVHEHMLSFGEVFLQTDWLDRSSFLFLFQTFTVWRSIRLWLLSAAPTGPSGPLHHSTAHPTETRTNMLLLKHESKQTVCSVKMIHSCEFTLTTKTKEIMYGAESPAVTCWGNKLRLCFVFKPSFVGFLIGWDKFTDLLLVSSQSSLSKDVQEQDQHQTATTEVRLRMWMSEGCNGENGGGWECESTPVWVFLKRRQNKRTVPLTDKMSSRVNHWAASWGNELWCEPCFRQKKDGVRETGIKWENKVFRGKENNGAESDKGRKMASCKDKQMEKDWIRWPEHWVRHVHDPFFMYDADQSI